MTVLDISQTAVVFPGQGSQTPGMRAFVAAVRPDLLDAACELAYIDVGPGRVLSKLVPRCIRGASAATADALLEDISAPV